MSKKNIRHQMIRAVEEQYKPATKRRAAERDNGGRSPKIHCPKTKETYIQHARQYGDFLRERGMNHATMEEARQHAPEYIHSFERPDSQNTARAALARVFDCRGPDICDTDRRHHTDIVRGREITDRAEAVERNYPEIVAVIRACGLRHAKEFEHLEARDLHWRGDELYVHVESGKGGRERDSIVLPGEGRDILIQRASEHSEGSLWERLPYDGNYHGYRADYAVGCYQYAMEHGYGDDCDKGYHPQDGSDDGEGWNKACMDWTNSQLGHGGFRYSDLYYHYLSYGK